MRRLAKALARGTVIGTALFGISWAVLIWRSGDRSSRLDAVASRIMAGESFPEAALTLASVKTAEDRQHCIPLELRSATIIRLRQYEAAIADGAIADADQKMATLRNSLDRSLRCVPTEAFFWFIRYWILTVFTGNADAQIPNLSMSYRLGSSEGWIALRRNVFALAVYRSLPPDVADRVRAEFAALIDAGFINVALNNLRTAGWPIRDELAASLTTVRPAALLAFDRALRQNEIQLSLPGVPEQEFRPWRR